MDEFWKIVQGMTFWNWIALIAFLFLPLSAVSSFLNVRSRYLDWRGAKNKKNFLPRLQQLEEQVLKVAKFRNSNSYLIAFGLQSLLEVFMWAFLSTVFLFTGFLELKLPKSDAVQNVSRAMLIVFIVLFMFVITKAARLQQTLTYIQNPKPLVRRIEEFVKEGKRKGLMTTECELLLEVIIHTLTENKMVSQQTIDLAFDDELSPARPE